MLLQYASASRILAPFLNAKIIILTSIMKESQTPPLSTTTIDRIIASVLERGFDDEEFELDDYGDLLNTYEFRTLAVFELYNAYFQPKRHEFDLQIITELVKELLSERQTAFIAGAAFSGIVGNATYDILKSIIARIIAAFKSNNKRQEPFLEIQDSVEKVAAFFQQRNQATIQEISAHTGVDAEKILPILRLLGYQSRRGKKKKTVWYRKR